MTKHRDFSSGDPAPADWPDALSEFLGSAALNFILRIKPGDATKLQVPAGADNDQVAIAINGRWRYNAATVERASLGGVARNMDVFVTGSDNVFTPGGGGETDSTVYAFGVAVVESGASPAGVALSRKVATAAWDGTAFTSVDVFVGAQAGTARHAATHAVGGSDPLSQSGWTNVAFAAGYTSAGTGAAAQWMQDGLGFIRLHGRATSAATIVIGDVIAHLPVGARPPAIEFFGCTASDATGSHTIEVKVHFDGTVSVSNVSGASGPALIDLTSICFLQAN